MREACAIDIGLYHRKHILRKSRLRDHYLTRGNRQPMKRRKSVTSNRLPHDLLIVSLKSHLNTARRSGKITLRKFHTSKMKLLHLRMTGTLLPTSTRTSLNLTFHSKYPPTKT
ncbi:Uncharacterised protein [uncultured archaeon]|nr:Uncharacterised protein [uncultured archaeon]